MRKQNSDNPEPPEAVGTARQLERIGKILAMTAIRDVSQQDQIRFLSSVGYTPTEIGEMLKTSANVVSVTLLRLKQQKKR